MTISGCTGGTARNSKTAQPPSTKAWTGKRSARARQGRRRQGSKPDGRDSARSAGRSPRTRRRHAAMHECCLAYLVSCLRCSICKRARSVACCNFSPSTARGGKVVGYFATWMPDLSSSSKPDLLSLLAGAKDDPQRRGFFRLPFVLVQPAQVKLHLAFISRLELADFQLHLHQSPQRAIVEKQVKVEILVLNRDALLPSTREKPAPSSSRNASISLVIAASKSPSRYHAAPGSRECTDPRMTSAGVMRCAQRRAASSCAMVRG